MPIALGLSMMLAAAALGVAGAVGAASAWHSWPLSLALGLVGVVLLVRSSTRLAARGKLARATVLDVQTTPLAVDGRPLCRIQLRVELAGRRPFEAHARRVLRADERARFEHGAVLFVRVDPDEPDDVLIVER
jgi:hypothetical protein